jgi:hypothetical protein
MGIRSMGHQDRVPAGERDRGVRRVRVIELQGVEQILSCVEPFLAEGAAFIGVSYDRMRISLEPEAASKNFVILPPRRSGT